MLVFHRPRHSALRLASVVVVLAALAVPSARGATPDDPEIRAAIARGIAALRQRGPNSQGGYDSLAGYALLKSGVDPADPIIEAHRKRVLNRFVSGSYKPSSHHFYEAGCDLMFLEALEDEQYEPHMRAVVDYLARGRLANGAWTYPSESGGGGGDQSISQYAVLGLWAAERAEIPVDPRLWDGIAAWQVQMQNPDGGFTYHPTPGGGGGGSTPTMTIAGISNLYVARQYLYGEIAQERRETKAEPTEPRAPPKFGVLKRVEAEEVATAAAANEAAAEPKEPTDYKPTTPVARIDAALRVASVQFNAGFPRFAGGVSNWPYYFWYGLERMAALGDVEVIGGIRWYDAGAAYMLKTQGADGSWGDDDATAFALLFLTRATSKILGREPPKPAVGVASGLLAGGRGLPEDLSQVVAVEDGRAQTRKPGEPLDELFAALGDPATGQTIEAQAAIVEKIRLGDREELLGQVDRVLELAEHPHAEVRRTAIWVLGRTEDLVHVDRLVAALLDENLDVAVEARNALCFLSRKPRGLGESDDPFAGAEFDADESLRTAVSKQWRQDAHARWTQWLADKRPYELRDRPSTLPQPEAKQPP